MTAPFYLILFLNGVNIWHPQEDVFKFDTYQDCMTASNVWLNSNRGSDDLKAICKDSEGRIVSTYSISRVK